METFGQNVFDPVNLDPNVSTSKLSEEILSADTQNIDSVEWDQKESKTYIYR